MAQTDYVRIRVMARAIYGRTYDSASLSMRITMVDLCEKGLKALADYDAKGVGIVDDPTQTKLPI